MIKDILIYEKDKEILTQKSELVDNINDEIKTLIQDLKDTLLAQPTGVIMNYILWLILLLLEKEEKLFLKKVV